MSYSEAVLPLLLLTERVQTFGKVSVTHPEQRESGVGTSRSSNLRSPFYHYLVHYARLFSSLGVTSHFV